MQNSKCTEGGSRDKLSTVGKSHPGGLQRHCSNVQGRNWESKSSAGIQTGKDPEGSQELLQVEQKEEQENCGPVAE